MLRICVTYNSKDIVTTILKVMQNFYIEIQIEIVLPIKEPNLELEYFVRNKNIDVYVIDPNYTCNGYDGIHLAERMKIISRGVMVVFVTNDVGKCDIVKIANTEPFAFINASNMKTQLPEVLKKAIYIKMREQCLFNYIKRGEKFIVPLTNVIYFVSMHRKVNYVCIDGKTDSFYDRLNNIEDNINKLSNTFIRINQSYLINKKYILSLIGNKITMINAEVLMVSRKYHDCLKKLK